MWGGAFAKAWGTVRWPVSPLTVLRVLGGTPTPWGRLRQWWRVRLPARGQLVYWARESGRFFSWQIAITLINVIAGLLVVRYLPKEDYAFYTIGFMAMAIFTNITSAGVSPAVNSLAGSHWEDPRQMGSIVNTAIAFRKLVALGFAIPIAAYGLWQFSLVEAGWASALALTTVFALGGMVELESSILKVPLVFARRIGQLQRYDVWVAASKLVGIVVAGLLWPTALTFAAVTIGSLVISWRLLTKASARVIDADAPVDADVRARIVSLFKPNIVSVVYWSFQAQITILLCTLVGTTSNVAEIGALGKLTLIFGLLGTFVGSYLMPAIAKAVRSSQILARFGLVMVIYTVVTALLVGVAAFYPELLLWILGEQYGNLADLLLLYVSVAMIGVFQGQVHSVCITRGWVKYFVWYAPLAIVTQLVLLFILDLSTIRDVIRFEGCVSSVLLALTLGIFIVEFVAHSRRSRATSTSEPSHIFETKSIARTELMK